MRPVHVLPIIAPIALLGCSKALAKERQQPADVELAIYKQDFALVSERRVQSLDSGRQRLELINVSNTLDPQSVSIQSEGADKILSTRYEMGVREPQEMIARLAGKEVQLMFPSNNGNAGNTIKGIIEPAADGGFMLRTSNKVYINPPGTIVAPAGDGIGGLPRLTAELDSTRSGNRDIQLDYLTRGLSWSADYHARLSAESMDLELWASVTNETGVEFPNAKIKFVAGEPNRAVDNRCRDAKEESFAAGAPAMIAQMESQPMGELHAYDAPGKATVGTNQMNRIPMMEKVRVPIKRDYSVALPSASWWQSPKGEKVPATLAISFRNEEAANLGIPLPSGAIRVYASGEEGKGYIGAAQIADTPKGSPVHLTLSNSFDVQASIDTIATEKPSKNTLRKSFRVTVSNAKPFPVTVRVVQPIYQKFRLSTESSKGVPLDSGRRQWTVHVPAQGQTSLSYTIDLLQ